MCGIFSLQTLVAHSFIIQHALSYHIERSISKRSASRMLAIVRGLPLATIGTKCPVIPSAAGVTRGAHPYYITSAGKNQPKSQIQQKCPQTYNFFWLSVKTGEKAFRTLMVTMVQIVGQFKRHDVYRPS